MEQIEITSNHKPFEVFFPKECDLDKVNKVKIRGKEFVPVVRCKECKFRHDSSIGYWKPCREVVVEDDWFCADGVRKEQDDGQTN